MILFIASLMLFAIAASSSPSDRPEEFDNPFLRVGFLAVLVSLMFVLSDDLDNVRLAVERMKTNNALPSSELVCHYLEGRERNYCARAFRRIRPKDQAAWEKRLQDAENSIQFN